MIKKSNIKFIAMLMTLAMVVGLVPDLKVYGAEYSANATFVQDASRSNNDDAGKAILTSIMTDYKANEADGSSPTIVNYVGNIAAWGFQMEAALKFTLPATTDTLTSAKLRLYVVNVKNSPTATVTLTDDNSWQQMDDLSTSIYPSLSNTSVLANNQPILGATGWKEINLTGAALTALDSKINATENQITLVIIGSTTSDNYFNFFADDNGDTTYRAQLILTFEEPVAPEMNVTGNSTSISDGDSTPSSADYTDFGNADVSGGTVSRTFTIENSGTGALTLSGTPKVSITGTNAVDFSVSSQPSSTIAATGSTTFTVQFDPSAVGTRWATLSISNDDGNENPYNFDIKGTGLANNYSATAGANTLTPTVGVDDAITLTVKDSLGNTDTDFDGAKNVTITGVEAAPDSTYGSFNGTVLDANSAGAGQVISVTFADGVATPNLKLNKADGQTIGFSIDTVTTPITNSLVITPTAGTVTSLTVTTQPVPGAASGDNFATQPVVTLKDQYGNICTSGPSATANVVATAKAGTGTWTIGGGTTKAATAGVATFTNLSCTLTALGNGAMTFTSTATVDSNTFNIPINGGKTLTADTTNNDVDHDIEVTFGADATFEGAITGVSFNGTALTVTTDYVVSSGKVTLKPSGGNAALQTPATANVVITATGYNNSSVSQTINHGAIVMIAVSQNITAPASNGGNFAQQPIITIKDAYGNICTSDNTTIVTVTKEDTGSWTLTGTTTATAISGVVTFTGLGAANSAQVSNAQLGFTSGSMTKVTSATVTLPAPTSSGSSGGGGSSSTTATSGTGTVEVIVNGKTENAGTETNSTEDGKTVVTVAVNNSIIESKIEEAVKTNTTGQQNVIQIPVTDMESDVVKVEITGDIVKHLETNTFDVSVKRDTVEYIIPAVELTISNVAKELGVAETSLKDIKVEVQITKLDDTVVEKYNEVAKQNGATIVFPPTAFEVVAKTTDASGKTENVKIDKFSNYVERIMEIPAGVDPSKITTGIVFNADGTYSHVPTEVYQKDEKWYAKLNSLTNSNYSVVWNPVTVKSVENHWAKDAVNDMASRLVIFNADTFEPNKAITRADFAEYIVRALGLYRQGEHQNNFTDVSTTGDRTLAILIASEYGIVTGYSDGTFRGDNQITREEAMTMYQRAMWVTKLTGTDTSRYQNYTDYAKVSGWATSYVKEVLSAHVFNGTTAMTIAPKASLTYAEAAQAIKNLLVESKLINK